MRDALTEPMRSIHGISHKVIVMALSALLIGAGGRRRQWMTVGASFVVVDTLVHNFLHRTGILQRFAAEHPYGLGCYRPGNCADILQIAASRIDVTRYNPRFPSRLSALCATRRLALLRQRGAQYLQWQPDRRRLPAAKITSVGCIMAVIGEP